MQRDEGPAWTRILELPRVQACDIGVRSIPEGPGVYAWFFEEFRSELGHLDKVVVNAGLGKGQPLGTGRFDANRETAETNFIGALAQTEAAAAIFRAQGAGHLVMVSSFLRPGPRLALGAARVRGQAGAGRRAASDELSAAATFRGTAHPEDRNRGAARRFWRFVETKAEAR